MRTVIRNQTIKSISFIVRFRQIGSTAAIPRFNHFSGSGFKSSDYVRKQGVPRIENGAHTSAREYFDPWDNIAIGH